MFHKEEAIANVVQDQQYATDLIRQEKEALIEHSEQLDHEIARLQRKERINEQALAEQCENAERRIEYE